MTQILKFGMLVAGVTLTIISVVYVSLILAFVGLILLFWGAILFYITPSKHVPLALLIASTTSNTNNIERILLEENLTEKGIYLPPKYLENLESSLIFIPKKPNQSLPKPEEITEKTLISKNRDGVCLTPPGFSLSQLFEKELQISFDKTDLNFVQHKLPKLFIEVLKIAETAELQIENNKVTIELTGNTFDEVCQQTRRLPRTHKSIGCLLSSAIACVLTKTTAKPITIQNETRNQETKITRIEYQILED